MSLCVSLSDTSLEGCLKVLESLRKDGSEMVEVRADLVSKRGKGSVDDEGMNLLCGRGHGVRKILTCRELLVDGFTDERRKLLERGIAAGAEMVDVEFEAPKEYREALLQCAKQHGTEVIISYHNYEVTPGDEDLKTIVNNCFLLGGVIAKIAVKSNSVADSARILNMYRDQERRIVALGMGSSGMITRVAALELGAAFTFVALSAESATAPGQLTLEEMRSIQVAMRRQAGGIEDKAAKTDDHILQFS